MNDYTYQQTLPLKLLPSYGRHDFIVGESNLEAVRWVDNFSKSKVNGLVIIGPIASGKSHLISTLKNKYKILEAEEVNEEKINILELKDLIIENIEKIENHYFFLHIINIVKEKNFKVGDTLSLTIENQELTSKWCSNYQNTIGGVGVVTDSWGMISIFLSNGDASKLLNCKDGSKVTIKAESLTKRLNLK